MSNVDDAGRLSLVARLLLGLVRGYQRWISPVLPPSCRFYPSCSQYAVEAIATHGALRGAGYAALRVVKCGPWHPGGVDFVKPARPDRAAARPAPEHGAS